MIGVLLDLNSLVEDGIGRLGYGKKVKDIHLKYIIQKGCRGKLKKKIDLSNPYFESNFLLGYHLLSTQQMRDLYLQVQMMET